MVGVVAGQPLDTIRIRLQQQGCQHKSISKVWNTMRGGEGVRGLFKGMTYPLYTTALQVRRGAVAAGGLTCWVGQEGGGGGGRGPGLAWPAVRGHKCAGAIMDR
jgi:hypothetical protein